MWNPKFVRHESKQKAAQDRRMSSCSSKSHVCAAAESLAGERHGGSGLSRWYHNQSCPVHSLLTALPNRPMAYELD